MKTPYGIWLLGMVALGCGHNPFDDGPILQGRWGMLGNDPALLIGLSVGAELQFGCSMVTSEEPLLLDADRNFGFVGRYYTSTAIVGGERRARVQGRMDEITGNTVTLTVDILGDGLPASGYTLQRGVDPLFDDQPPSCPQ